MIRTKAVVTTRNDLEIRRVTTYDYMLLFRVWLFSIGITAIGFFALGWLLRK